MPFARSQVAVAATAVIARLESLRAGFFTHGLHCLGGAGAPVGVAVFQQFIHIGVVDVGTLRLIGPLTVPVQPEPAHGSQDGVGILLL